MFKFQEKLCKLLACYALKYKIVTMKLKQKTCILCK